MSDLAAASRQRRADAERSITAILDAALAVLAERPDASVAEVAAAAGVSRQTVYAHYSSREALLAAVAERALGATLAAIDAVELERGSAAAALDRLIASWWGSVARYARVLDALAAGYPSAGAMHELHAPILTRLEQLIRRGQREGEFDSELAPEWLAAAFLGLMHASADEVAAGRVDEAAAAAALGAAIPRLFGCAG